MTTTTRNILCLVLSLATLLVAAAPASAMEFLGSLGSASSSSSSLTMASAITADSTGNVYVGEAFSGEVQKLDTEGRLVDRLDLGAGDTSIPTDIAVDFQGNVYVAATDVSGSEASGGRILKFDREGNRVDSFALTQPLGRSSQIVTDSHGDLYVLSGRATPIQRFSPDGTHLGSLGPSTLDGGRLHRIAIDGGDNLYVSDGGSRIYRLDTDGNVLDAWGESGASSGQFQTPTAIAADRAGYVYVLEAGRHRVQQFTSDGEFVHGCGREGFQDREFELPYDVATGPAGRVYVADVVSGRSENRIKQFGQSGSGGVPCDFPPPVAIVGDSKSRVSRRGVVKLGLECKLLRSACDGTIALKARRVRPHATTPYSIGAGSTGKVRLTLPPKALRQVLRAGKRGLRVEVVVSAAAGVLTETSRLVGSR